MITSMILRGTVVLKKIIENFFENFFIDKKRKNFDIYFESKPLP